MEDIQVLVNRAVELKNEGNLMAALSCYNDAFDMLIHEANSYARQQDGSVKDIGSVRAIMPKLFDESKKYLKSDMTAAVISNNMGTLMARLGDFDGAKKMFEQSVDLTPDNKVYDDPIIGLKEIEK